MDLSLPSNLNMSSSHYRALTPPARIPKATFLVSRTMGLCNNTLSIENPAFDLADDFQGIAWGGVALAWMFFLPRIFGRIKVFRRLYADDAMVFIACLFLTTNTLIWQMSKDDLYELMAVASGQQYPPPLDLPKLAQACLRRSVAVIALFYSGLWAIKLSFMLFFRRLGQNVRNQEIIWWPILAVIVATWLACLGTIQYRCLTGSFEYIESTDTESITGFNVLTQASCLLWIYLRSLSEEHAALEYDYGCDYRCLEFVSTSSGYESTSS